jgi:predicted DCC family thiol-disulfide oxidoreductase YuxK
MDTKHENIVFYDGDCGFCNKSVQFILRHEKRKEIYFSAIQSEYAKQFFRENKIPEPDLSTFYFYTNYLIFTKSNAAFAILRLMRFPYSLLQIFRIIPVCQRNQIYDYVAKRRHRIMSGFCVVPTDEQKKRFLVE